MGGQVDLHHISKNLQQIKGNSRPFGGVHVFLLGDIRQAGPVCKRFMHDDPKKNPCGHRKDRHLVIDGFRLFKLFKRVIILDVNYRLKGAADDPEQMQFHKRQLRLGDGPPDLGAEDAVYWEQFTAEALPERTERFRKEHKTTYIVTTNDRITAVNFS